MPAAAVEKAPGVVPTLSRPRRLGAPSLPLSPRRRSRAAPPRGPTRPRVEGPRRARVLGKPSLGPHSPYRPMRRRRRTSTSRRRFLIIASSRIQHRTSSRRKPTRSSTRGRWHARKPRSRGTVRQAARRPMSRGKVESVGGVAAERPLDTACSSSKCSQEKRASPGPLPNAASPRCRPKTSDQVGRICYGRLK